jgi:hypothetical protein
MGWQYTLRATRTSVYFTRLGTPVLLQKNDVFKIGETRWPPGSGPNQRYSRTALTARGLYWWPEFYGTKTQIKIVEKMKLADYLWQHGKLPPGNSVLR